MRFDDIRIDEAITVGSHRFTRDEILEFARDFDPQPFHVDDDAAAASHFGGLIASGWHTTAIWMRLTVDWAAARGRLAGIAPGRDEIRWPAPVRPGDTVTYANTARSKRRLASRPGWMVVQSESTGVNQRGETVLHMSGPVFLPIDD